MALPRNTSTKPNLESTKLAQFTPKEKCVQKPEPNILQYMILGFWTLAFAANMVRNMKQIQKNQVKTNDQIGGGEWSNWRRIVCPRLWQKLWTENFFCRHFLKIHVLPVPIMCPSCQLQWIFFSGSASELKIPLLKGFVPPTHWLPRGDSAGHFFQCQKSLGAWKSLQIELFVS